MSWKLYACLYIINPTAVLYELNLRWASGLEFKATPGKGFPIFTNFRHGTQARRQVTMADDYVYRGKGGECNIDISA